MSKIDLVGKRFGRLLVVKENGRGAGGSVMWDCVCDCGTKKTIHGGSIRNGTSKSCGCLQKDVAKSMCEIHNKSYTKEYRCWVTIKNRCYNPKHERYKDYGGRGIVVCERWLNSFDSFYADMGDKPSAQHTIDRFPNVNGNYEPSNCRWATPKEQGSCKRNTHWLEYNGKKMILADWAKHFDISPSTIYGYLKRKSEQEMFSYYALKYAK